MAIDNFTVEQLKHLDPKSLTKLVNEVHGSIRVVGGKKTLDPKYCAIWAILRVLLMIAKAFTDDDTDKKIDDIIIVGDAVCVS